MSRLLQLTVFLCLAFGMQPVYATCDDALPAQGVRDDVLIIVNDNSLDSCEVGRYYAEKRGLGRNNILHVATPASYWLNWNEFRGLRDQIIHHMQQHSFKDANVTPVICADGDPPFYCSASMTQMQQQTKIRYIVMTRGVPTRTTVDNSSLNWRSSTSVDNYLSYWLVRYFSVDSVLSFSERERAFKDGRGMRIVEPAEDKEIIVGRIDGINLQAAKSLIDRTMDVEANGLYGKHYGSRYGRLLGRAQWMDYSTNRLVYGTSSSGDTADSWRYQLGIFGETRPECIDYLNFSRSTAAGKAPAHCNVRFSESQPGTTGSRTPIAEDALVYQGSLHGQISGAGNFNNILNWVRNRECTVKLCENAADPATCQAQSTDPFKELNTACVGVAEGFMGFNYQSFPVSYMTSWPTGWRGPGGGSNNNMGFPEVRDDIGYDDAQSLWYRNTDTVANTLCYAVGADFSVPPTLPCRDQRRVALYQTHSFAAEAVDLVTPQTYRVRFWYKTENISEGDNLRVRLRVREPSNTWIDYGNKTAASFAVGNTSWTMAEVSFPLDPTLHADLNKLYDRIEVYINSGDFTGDLGLDNFSIQELNSATEFARNPSFTEGHKEVSGGDHASMYLSRLNGVAFWGSASHHQSGGHSFSRHQMETLLYFYRGLPLGDAVWWAEDKNSGLFYGDPIYSPVAVRFDYLNDRDLVAGAVTLSGSTVNGRDTSIVTTQYSVDYCPGSDFYVCDQAGSWQPTGIGGVGGQENMPLGSWDSATLVAGDYTLRLAVSSQNSASGKQQSLYDFYPVTMVDPNADADGDDISNADEINVYGTTHDKADSDADGLSDGDEILLFHTDPLSNIDSDLDGMSDDWERARGTDPNGDDARSDADNDGVDNVIEFLRGTLPNDAASAPTLVTIYVDAANTSGVEDGSAQNPYSDMIPAVNQAQHGDAIRLAPGTYLAGQFLAISKSIDILGPEDRSAAIAPGLLFFSNMKRATISGITFSGYFSTQNVRNMELSNCVLNVTNHSYRLGSKVTIRNCLRPLIGTTVNGVTVSGASDVELINSTIAGFTTGINILDSASVVTVHNSILNNSVDFAGPLNGVSVSYSLISDGQFSGANGNISADPVFVDTVNGDFHLAAGSPAIDAGDPGDAYDLEPEPNGCRINMGAYGDTAEAGFAPDPDGDALYGYCENRFGSDPNHPDSDRDTLPDGLEVVDGSDPVSRFSPNAQGMHLSNDSAKRVSTLRYAASDVMHILAWSNRVDAANIKFATYNLTSGSTLLASGNLGNPGDGSYSASINLAGVNHSGDAVLTVQIQQDGSKGVKYQDSRSVVLGSTAVADLTPPTLPSAVIADAGKNRITLLWQAADDDAGVLAYDIERTVTTGSPVVISMAHDVLRYVDSDLAQGTTVSYRIRARDASGKVSAFTPMVSATAK